MAKRSLFLTVVILFTTFLYSFSQITTVVVDPGPYSPGSSIAATFKITDGTCLRPGNVFELYLSDNLGSFTNATRIGSYTGFYSTFVNGTIPAGIPTGSLYRVQIRTTQAPVLTSNSGYFSINASSSASIPDLNSASTVTNTPKTFGKCDTEEGTALSPFRFTNASNTADVKATITNELNPGTAVPDLVFNSIGGTPQTIQAEKAHYTIFVRAVMPDGSIGTKAYFLINNLAVTAFSTISSNTVCYPIGSFEYLVNVTDIGGIKLNFPGNTYKIDWGDGSNNEYTYCDIKNNPLGEGRVQHTFSRSSCGLTYTSGTTTTYNVFGINVGVFSPWCNAIGTPISTTAKVISRPENKFTSPDIACVGTLVTFLNESTAGQKPSSTSASCSENNVVYSWWVDGVEVEFDKPKSFNFEYRFSTKKTYTIRLTSVSDGNCQADVFEKQICIQDPPVPKFELSSDKICLTSGTITTTDLSTVDNSCGTTPTYTWNVSPAAGVSFIGANGRNSIAPQIKFTQIGEYDISLTIRNGGCAETSVIQKVVVDDRPIATLSDNISLCAKGPYSFDPLANSTKTTLSGTGKDLSDTYTWEVTGGAYSYVAPSTANSKYPVINFQDYGAYTVKLTYKNNCNTITAQQVITFIEAPAVSININPNPICYGANAELEGVISNTNYASVKWSVLPGGGTFSSDNTKITSYTPTAAERLLGKATVTFTVTTNLTGLCRTIAESKEITIYPNNTGTNDNKTICTGTSVDYLLTSSIGTSTYSWTSQLISGTATGYGFGSGSTINEVITNSDEITDAVIVYTITPKANGCDGEIFKLTVRVVPKPKITASPANPQICSGSSTGITLATNLLAPTVTTYKWTSVASSANIEGFQNQTAPTPSNVINQTLTNNGTTSGTVTYTITPYSGTDCPGDAITVIVQVDPKVTIATAGSDEDICNVSNYTLSGNIVKAGETGTWTLSSGPNAVTFINEHSPTATAQGLVSGGTYVFKWTITGSGECAATSNEVSIHVNEPTVAGSISGGTTVCSGTNTGQINLTGNTGTVVEWRSSIDNGSTWQIATGTNTSGTLTYNNLTVATQYYAVVQNGSCLAANTNIITINVAPPTSQAKAGPDQELCEAIAATLSGNTVGTGESGRWVYVNGPAAPTIVDPTDPLTRVTDLQIGGTYEFKWIITGNAPCNPTEDIVIIKSLSPIDQSISNPSPVICYDQTIHIRGSQPTGGNGVYTYVWESKTPTGSWTPIPNQTGPDLELVLQASISFRRIVTSGSCTKTSNETDITVQDPIRNNEISANQNICTNVVPAILTGSTPTGSDGNFFYIWESSTDGGSTWVGLNAFDLNYQPLALTTTTMFRRIAYTSICDGAQKSISAAVTITVRPDPIAFFTATNQTGCAPFLINASNVRAAEHPLINGTYTWYVNDVLHNTGPTFRDYTITENGQPITIKLVVTPKVGCNTKEFMLVFNTRAAVPASFTQSATEICGPAGVRFVNTAIQSAGATFFWDFGNGQTSNQANPAPVNFNPDPAGRDLTYTISLTSTTPCGSNTVTSTLLVKAVPIAVFSPSKTVGCSPMLVNFSNTSPGGTNTYTYDFGDGSPTVTTTNKLQPISHIYNTTVTTTFVATMTAVNDCGTDIKRYNIQVSPQNITPELVVDAKEKKGCAPLTVNFDNNSIGATHFTFDFGDGGTMNTTTPGRVQHIFTKPGRYTITMTAFNNCSEIIETEEVEVLEQPLAAFNADLTLGCAGLAVQFKNTTQDGFSYIWDFGDGSTSNEFEPKHVYNGDQEYYTVTLTATNTLGCSISISKNQYIHIVPPPTAAFHVNPSTLISIPDYTFKFEDESTNGPTTWAWDFGDGTTSEKQHPIHTYPDTGTYKVTLTTFNQQGCFTSTFKHVTIKGVPGYLFVPNSFIPGSEYPELRVFAAKGSGIASWKFSIFNKWAELVWETTKLDEGRPAEGWDGNYKGSPAPQGVYFWKIDVKMINGTEWKGMTYDKSVPKRTGAIHLIR